MGGGPQGTLLGQIEYLVQSNDNADVVDPEDRYKYIDDLSVLQLILLSGLHILKPWNLWINFTGIFFPVPCVNTNRSVVS